MSIFLDNSGNFQWSSITAIVAGLALVVSGYNLLLTFKQNKIVNELTQKKIDADVKSKTRIDFLQKVRELAAEYITSSFQLIYYIYNYLEIFFEFNKTEDISKVRIEINKNRIELILKYNLLILYFPSNDILKYENEFGIDIIRKIDFLNKKIFNLIDKIDKKENIEKENIEQIINSVDDIENSIDNLLELLRQYFDQEWNKARNCE